MSATSIGNNYLNNISNPNTSSKTSAKDTEDVLGRDSFLTMLVAQLENQDPLNPMDGTDFSAQLAQFSQLEQLMNLNKTMEGMVGALTENSEGDVLSYIGKTVSGKMDAIDITNGIITGGSYKIDNPADIMVSITNSQGNTIRTLYPGQQTPGTHSIEWDGRDSGGNLVADGTYHYSILANTGSGFVQVPSTITGLVEAVVYNDNKKPYLIVDGAQIDVESLIAIKNTNSNEQTPSSSLTDYLGKNVTASASIVLVESGSVFGEALEFELDRPQNAVVQIYDQNNQLVRSIVLEADSTEAGINSVSWDGRATSGETVDNGLYYFTVETADDVTRPAISGEVTSIRYVDGYQYLVMKDSGRLVSPYAVTGIN